MPYIASWSAPPQRVAVIRRGTGPELVGDDDYLGGLSLRGIGRAVKRVASPVQKAAARVGHAVGKAATSNVGKAVIGAALAATGVGLPAAAAIGAASQAGGQLLRPGGNLRRAGSGAVQGAAIGAASSIAGTVARKGVGTVARKGFGLIRRKPATPAEKSALDSLPTTLPQVTMTPTAEVAPPLVVRESPEAYRAAGKIWSPGSRSHGAPDPRASTPTSTTTKRALIPTFIPKASGKKATVADKLKAAGKVVDAGKVVRKKVKSVADKADGFRRGAERLAEKAAAVAAAGDAIGAGRIAELARAAAENASNAASQADRARESLDTVGRAAEGAGAGAVAGAAGLDLPKALLIGAAALGAVVLITRK